MSDGSRQWHREYSRDRLTRDPRFAPRDDKFPMFSRTGTIVVVVVLGIAVLGATLLSDPLPRFVARRSALAGATQIARSIDHGYELQQFRLTATSGLSVELTVRRALSDSGKLPLALILGGHYKGRDAVKMLPDTHGTLVAVMSYPFGGDPRPDRSEEHTSELQSHVNLV